MKYLLSLFNLKLPFYYVYMLQQVEYDPRKFWAWTRSLIKQDKPISSVMTRKTLVMTARAKLLLFASYVYVLVSLAIDLYLTSHNTSSTLLIIVSVFSWLLSLAFMIEVFLYCLVGVAFLFVIRPQQKKLLNEATNIFAKHGAVKIAVLGSYGKTTMKEMLHTVLSEGKKVATTPGNMNVSVSHARFAKKLTGDEDVIIVEFGEGEPGDIARMSKMLKPDYAIITGLAPNHLDHYSDLKEVATDLLDIYEFVDSEKVFVSGESAMLKTYLPKDAQLFTVQKTTEWQTKNIKVSVNETSFDLTNGNDSIRVNSALLGRHQVAPLSCVAVLANKLGLTVQEIESGLSKTKPYEHRMQPRLVQGAWLIDDTYNGNLEGLQAGLKLLSELEAQRKWYVTPGLVDQGRETERVHVELGRSIAEANPNIVVLMENSARPTIEESMKEYGFTGELRIEPNPLEFYTNIEHIVAVGDIVLMQNDWTDNYS